MYGVSDINIYEVHIHVQKIVNPIKESIGSYQKLKSFQL